MCELKRDLIAYGVPEESIGLLHSYAYDEDNCNPSDLQESYASEPCSDELQDKQFMLITHQRIKGNKSDLDRFNAYNGKPRHLLIWDESLVVSESKGISMSELEGCLGYINGKFTNEAYDDVKSYLSSCIEVIDNQPAKGDGLIRLPEISQKDIERHSKLLYRLPICDVLLTLFEFIHENIRVAATGGGVCS